MDSPKKLGSAVEFDRVIQSLIGKESFTSLDEQEQAKAITDYRDGYIAATQIEDGDEISKISDLAKSYFDYSKASRVQPTEDDIKKLGVKLPDLTALPTDEALARLEETKNLVNQKLPETFDPVLQEDYGFYLDQFFSEQERQVRGRETGRVSDLGARAMQGAVSRVMTTIGLDTEEFNARYFAENPTYDDSWWSDLAQGGGDMAATVGLTLFGSLVAGPAGAAGVGLYTNSVGKYAEAYKQVFNETGNHYAAHDAGIGALPGAAVETIGDAMLAGRFTKAVPKSLKEELAGATSLEAKRKLVADKLKDANFQRNIAKGMLEGSYTEALTEVGGSYVSGVGASLLSGEELTPSGAELAREGSVALVLGGLGGGIGELAGTARTRNQLAKLEEGFKRFEEQLPTPEKSVDPETNKEVTTVTTPDGKKTVLEGDRLDSYNTLRDLLLNRAPLDALDTLPQGRGKGQRNSPPANNERSLVREQVDQLNIRLNQLIPERANLYEQLDALAVQSENNITPEQVNLFKVANDAVALNLIRTGGDPNTFFGNVTAKMSNAPQMTAKRWKQLQYRFDQFYEKTQGMGPDHPEYLGIANDIFEDVANQYQPGWFRRLEEEYKREVEAREKTGPTLDQFIGEGANLTEQSRAGLQMAQTLIEQGEDSNKVRLATGWFQNPHDGKWRQEISDESVKFDVDKFRELSTIAYGAPVFNSLPDSAVASMIDRDTTLRLDQVFEYPELYQAYPEARDIHLFPIGGSVQQGMFFTYNGQPAITASVTLDKDGNISDETKKTILHEIQHYIQLKEGFATGGTLKNLINYADLDQARASKKIQDKLTAYEKNLERLIDEAANMGPIASVFRAGRKKELNESIKDLTKSVNDVREELGAFKVNTDQVQGQIYNAINAVDAELGAGWEHSNRGEGLRMIYQRLAGEVEAREVEGRFGMTDEQRQANEPFANSFPADQVIVRYNQGSNQKLGQRSAAEVFEPDALVERHSRDKLVEMPIDDFLALAAPVKQNDMVLNEVTGEAVTSRQSVEIIKQAIESGGKIPEAPFIQIRDTDGSVTGHEGRHRAMALKELGYETMPVVFKSNATQWDNQTQPGAWTYRAVWFNKIISESGNEYSFPISRDGQYVGLSNELNPTFGEFAVQRLDADYMRYVEEGKKELAQQIVDFFARQAGWKPVAFVHGGGFDPAVDPVPVIGPNGFHVGTRAAAEERVLLKVGDDYIAGATIHQDPDTGKWYWVGNDGQDSGIDFDQQQQARDDLYAYAASLVDDATDPEDLATFTNLYVRVLNPMPAIDPGADWSEEIARAKEYGYDGIIYSNRFEHVGSTSMIAFYPHQLKLADAVARDLEGNIIPPSQRFNPENDSVLYQIQQTNKTKRLGVENGQAAWVNMADNGRWTDFNKIKNIEDLNRAAEVDFQQVLERGTPFEDSSRYVNSILEDPQHMGNAQVRALVDQYGGDREAIIRDFNRRTADSHKEVMQAAADYLDAAHSDSPTFKSAMLRATLYNMSRTDVGGPMALHPVAVDQVRAMFDNGDIPSVKALREAYLKVLEDYTTVELESKDTAIPGLDGGMWVLLPQVKEGDNAEAIYAMWASMSHERWCTSKGNEKIYSHEGPMYVFRKDGQPQLAIRFVGEEVEEIQSPANDGTVPSSMLGEIKHFLKENKNLSVGAKKTIAMAEANAALTERLQRELQEEIAEGAEWENGIIQLKGGMFAIDSVAVAAGGLDEFQLVSDSDGFLAFSDRNVNAAMGGITYKGEKIPTNKISHITGGGAISIQDSPGFKNLKIASGKIEIATKGDLTRLDKLEIVIGSLSLRDAPVILPSLERITGDLDAASSSIIANSLKSTSDISISGEGTIEMQGLELVRGRLKIDGFDGDAKIGNELSLEGYISIGDSSGIDINVGEGTQQISLLRSNRIKISGSATLDYLRIASSGNVNIEGVATEYCRVVNSKDVYISGATIEDVDIHITGSERVTMPNVTLVRQLNVHRSTDIDLRNLKSIHEEENAFIYNSKNVNLSSFSDRERLIDSNSEIITAADFSDKEKLFQRLAAQAQGSISFNDSLNANIEEYLPHLQAAIKIMREGGNITTLFHEMFHYWHRSGAIAQILTPDQLKAFEAAANVNNGQWTRDSYELAARTFEAWLRNPGRPGSGDIRAAPALQRAFQRIAEMFRSVYRSLRDSGLPFRDKNGRAMPAVDPGFRDAFEALFQIQEQPNIELQQAPQPTSDQPDEAPQNASQSRQVNVGYEGGEPPVSPQQEVPAAQPAATDEVEPYARDDRDKLNIRLLDNTKSRGSSVTADSIRLFKAILNMSPALHENSDQAGLFYAALDAFIRARKLVPEGGPDGDYQLLTASPKIWEGIDYYSTDAYGQKTTLKAPFEQGFVEQVNGVLRDIKRDVEQRAYDRYKRQNEEHLKDAPEGLSLKEMQVWVREKRKEELSKSEETPERRQSINDNALKLQANLRTRDLDDLMVELGVNNEVNSGLVRDYLEFLSGVDVTSEQLSDVDAMELMIKLDEVVNNGTLLGMKVFARSKAKYLLGMISDSGGKWRDPFSKWGLGSILNKTFGHGDAFNEFLRKISLTATNFERITENTKAKQALNKMFADYQTKIGQYQQAENRWSKFLVDTKKKWWPDGADYHDMHRAGMISKIMQTPRDADAEAQNQFLRDNVTELQKGFQNMVDFGGSKGKAGRAAMKMLNGILDGLDVDNMSKHEFMEHVAEKFPKENGFIMDMVGWIEENIKQDAIFISEGLYGVEFHEFDLYLPTRQVPLDESKYDGDTLDIADSAMISNAGDGGYGVSNPVRVDRSEALKERKGYVKKGFAFATNLENTLDTSIKAILNDIYTGFDRQALSYLFNQNSNLRAELEQAMGGGHRVAHLASTIHDAITNDLNRHKPVNGVELAVNRLKAHIGPAHLGSLHQFLSQPISQFTSHIFRRGSKILPHYVDAMKLLTEVEKESELYQGWLIMKEAHLSTRALPHDPLFVKGKQYREPNAFELLGNTVLEKLGVESKGINQMFGRLKELDEQFKQNVLLGPLRVGDLFSADLIFAAELIEKAKKTMGTNDLSKLDLLALNGDQVLECLEVMDQSINASRNSRRGALLAHPNAIMSLLTVFSGHRLAMATNAGLKLRNILELNSDDEMVADAYRALASTFAQSVAFTLVKAAVVGAMARGIYLALTPDEDDKRHWLYGDLEQQEVQAIRKLRDDSLRQSFSADALTKATLKDAAGSFLWSFSFFGMDNFWFGRIDDFARPSFNQSKEELVKELKARLANSNLTPDQAKDIRNQIKVVEGTKYVPMSYRNFDEVQLGGAYGLAAEPLLSGAQLATELLVEGAQPADAVDFILLGRLLGYSQPDIARFLKAARKNFDKLEKLREDEEDELIDFGF